jgi:uncharacterized protein
MLRKRVRKYLPDHETIRNHRYLGRLGPRLHHPNLWHLHRRSVAGGVAAGMFAGLIPGSNPVQFTVAAIIAIVFRVNLPIAVAVTLYSNPFTIVPLYYVAFKLGQLALMQSGNPVPPLGIDLVGKPMHEWIPAAFDWLSSLGKPLLVGVPLLAVLLAVIGYFGIDWAWRGYVRYAWHRRKKRRAIQS